jgi:metal-responsive CopG/Arc/MetJ family transcriptional regulator
MVKTTITVDDELWKEFSIVVIQEKGNRKKNDVIGDLIRSYVNRKKEK